MNCGIDRKLTDPRRKKDTVVIVGPTAVGKSALGLRLARYLPGEIISADSRQIYRFMDIGTAKPTPEEQEETVHHCIDICDPDEYYSAGRFAREARSLISELHGRGAMPILIGGAGLYLSALLDGLFEADSPSLDLRRTLSSRLQEEGLASLYQELARLDPIACARISPNDQPRILRALEIALGTPANRSQHFRLHSKTGHEDTPIMFGLWRDRGTLYRRVNDRVDAMMAEGWVLETAKLLEMGFTRSSAGFGSLGYAELARHLENGTDLAREVEAIKRRSRRYAKRQITWFRKDRRLRWLDLDNLGEQGALDRIATQVNCVQANAEVEPAQHLFQDE